MRQAETVAFGGSALDRAQLLRGDVQALNLAWTQAKVLPFWRGRPLTEGEGDSKTLAWLPSAHPLFATTTAPIFLGQDGGQDGGHPCFAVDISATLTAPSAPPAGPFDTARQPHPALPPTQGFADLRAVMAVLSPRQAELVAMAKALLEWHRTHG
ncbi:MAG: NUDIX-like domain-containing protein, partial [Paracoccaceae bacterium]